MEFLFHTVIIFDRVMVYYNVFKNNGYYFVQVLHNPDNADAPVSFNMKRINDEWKSSVTMSDKQIQALGEEIERNERG
ncbi:MAG TPA: hypothetical protein VI489_03020 [Candidatus Brocadiaceae bacterium]